MRTFVHFGVEFDRIAEWVRELHACAPWNGGSETEKAMAVLAQECSRLIEIAFVGDLESHAVAGVFFRLAQHQRVMLVLFAAAKIYRVGIRVLDMKADGILIERTTGRKIDDVQHHMAAAQDVERADRKCAAGPA